MLLPFSGINLSLSCLSECSSLNMLYMQVILVFGENSVRKRVGGAFPLVFGEHSMMMTKIMTKMMVMMTMMIKMMVMMTMMILPSMWQRTSCCMWWQTPADVSPCLTSHTRTRFHCASPHSVTRYHQIL